MSEPEEGRFRSDSNLLSIDDCVTSDTHVPMEALTRTEPYRTEMDYANSRDVYHTQPVLPSQSHESLYANRSFAPYKGSDFEGSLAAAYPSPTTDPALPSYRDLCAKRSYLG